MDEKFSIAQFFKSIHDPSNRIQSIQTGFEKIKKISNYKKKWKKMKILRWISNWNPYKNWNWMDLRLKNFQFFVQKFKKTFGSKKMSKNLIKIHFSHLFFFFFFFYQQIFLVRDMISANDSKDSKITEFSNLPKLSSIHCILVK